MDETELRLDGNAVAGILQEAFLPEVTSARGRCAACGEVGEMGAQHLYMYPHSPGAVLRCRYCEGILAVIVRGGGRLRLAMQGMVWLEVPDPAAPV
jgi:hypothetical protein